MALTNAQMQARIESLENMMRVIVNQDPTRIQPVGTTASDGYTEANGRVAAANHVHPGGVAEPVMVARFSGSLSYGPIASAIIQSDLSVDDYLQGFAFCRDETVAAAITVSDTKGNSYALASPIGVVGTEVSPVETSSTSTWVVPFGAHIVAPLTVADNDAVNVSYGTSIGNQEGVIVQVPGCGTSGPLAITSAVNTGTAASSGDTDTLPQPKCFIVGLIASYFGTGITWGPGWSSPGAMTVTGSMNCWAESVNSNSPVSATGTIGADAGWAAIVIPFAIP